MNASIRPMVTADIDEVARLERVSYATPWSREQFSSLLADTNCYSARVAVCPALVGYSISYMAADECTVCKITVAPARRCAGIGTLLLKDVLDRAATLGCRTAWLEVRASNSIAIRLYENFNFLVSDRRRNYYNDNGEDGIIMCKTLAAIA